MRPCDANEAVEAWRIALSLKRQPVALILTRQNLPTLDRTKYAPASNTAKGAYTLIDAPNGKPDVILMATGSEVSLCTEAFDKLAAEGIHARVVSMPSWELFEHQSQEYRDSSVIPPSDYQTCRRRTGVHHGLGALYGGLTGAVVGMKTFGASALLKVLQQEFGFTVDNT